MTMKKGREDGGGENDGKWAEKKRSSFGRANAASRGVSLKWFVYLDAGNRKRLLE